MGEFLDEIADHVPALRRYALALTQNRDRADDLVQDCLERAIRKRRLWRPSGSLKSWLFKILLNISRNEARRRVPTEGAVVLEADDITQAPSQLDRVALAHTARALERLPDDQKEVLILIVLEQASYRQAAEILDIPIGTVMSRLSRARQNLAQLMEGRPARETEAHLRTVK